MRRRRRYDDYLSQEPASPMASVAAERELASSGQQPANLAPLLAAVPSGRLSVPQAGMLAHWLGNRSFGSLISRSSRIGPRVSPQDEFIALQDVASSGQRAISSRAAAGQSSGMQEAPAGATVAVSTSVTSSSGSSSAAIGAPSGASGAGGINISSSSLQPPTATPLAGALPVAQATSGGATGAISSSRIGAAPALDAGSLRDESGIQGGTRNRSGVTGVVPGTGLNATGVDADSSQIGGKPQSRRPHNRARFAAGSGGLEATSFAPVKPRSDVRSRQRTRVRSAQNQTERDAGQITSQAGQVSTGAPAFGNMTPAQTPGAGDVCTASERQGQVAVGRVEPGGRESDLDLISRNVPVIELEPGTPVTEYAGMCELLLALVRRSVEALRTTLRDTATRIKEVVTRIASSVVNVVRSIISQTQRVLDQVRATITSTLAAVRGTLVRMASSVMALVTRARTAVSGLLERVTAVAGDAVDWVRDQVSELRRRAAQLVVSLVGSIGDRIVNWLTTQATRTITLIRQANEAIRGLINAAFILVFRKMNENREQLHRDIENQLGSGSPIPPRTRQQYRRFVREMATRQMITQANVVAQRIRRALMPLSKGINTAAAFVFTKYNSLVFSFRSTFAEHCV